MDIFLKDTSVAHYYALLSELHEGNLECEESNGEGMVIFSMEVVEHLVGWKIRSYGMKKRGTAAVAQSLNIVRLSKH